MKKSTKMLLALFAVFALFAAACGDDETTDTSSDAGEDDSAAAAEEEDMAEEDMAEEDDMAEEEDMAEEDAHEHEEDANGGLDPATIGEGVELVMGRATWASGYIQAEIYNQILTSMGYTIGLPENKELDPSAAYLAMAEGSMDFWTNSWYPGHFSWHAAELPDGSIVGDYLTVVEGLFPNSGVQGFLTTKSVVDEYNITSMQQINDDPELVALFDSDGNGKAEIFGCPESWTCDDIFTSQIAFYEWNNIEQTKAGYDAMIAEALNKANAGEPMAIYTWSPSAYVTKLIPGDNVYWLTMHPTKILDDSNPVGTEGGEAHTQEEGFSGFGPEFCTDPCQLGWKAADIQVTARTEVLEANPVLGALFPKIKPSLIDILVLMVEQSNGDGTQEEIVRIASEWLATNQALVDGWIAEAITEIS